MNNNITEKQYMAIILSALIGIGILSLPQESASVAKQDAWLSTILGASFPLIILLISSYIDKKMKHKEFWEVIKILYGKYLSYIVPFVLMIISLFYQSAVVSGYVRVLRQSISSFLPPLFIICVVLVVTLITSSRGMTVIGRLCELILFFLYQFYSYL